MTHRPASNTRWASRAPTCNVRRRIRVVFCGFLLVFGSIVARLVHLQAFPDPKLMEYDRIRRVGAVVLSTPRGAIYDRSGRILATNREVFSLVADPRKITTPHLVAESLSARLQMDYSTLYSRLTLSDDEGKKRKGVAVKRWLTEEEAQRLGDLQALAGGALRIESEQVRFYPQAELAAHVLGFANRDNKGCEGVELMFDRCLQSTPGRLEARKDGRLNLLPFATLDYTPPKGGEDIHLTLDVTVQYTLERELDKAMEANRAARATGVVMNPWTGAILALACRPAFDPNEYWKYSAEERRNRVVTDVFEPGSAFKIVTAAAALENGLITPDTLIDCENGAFNPYGRRIRDFHRLGIEPFSKCFEESSNIAIIKVAAMLGAVRLESWIRMFGFGQRTCPDLPMESAGIFRPVEQWSKLSMGSLPMGQEIAVTALQLVRAFAVIANGGYLVEPYLVERAVDESGQVTYARQAPPARRILSAATAAAMQQLCHQVVTHGTGRYANIAEFRAGGKTGTAQVAKETGGGYYADRYTTIFAGFAPLSRPQLCAVIVLHQPNVKLHYGGYVCGPVFKAVVRETLINMHCPPDPVVGDVKEPVVETEDADTVTARLGVPEIREPSEEELLAPLEELELAVREEDSFRESRRLPDLVGMTKRQVQATLAALQLNWNAQGTGWVIAQEPPAGTPLHEVTVCQLVFSSRRDVPNDDPQRTVPTSAKRNSG